MVQTGDPTNTGKGGKSIWGDKFSDEIKVGILTVNMVKRIADEDHAVGPEEGKGRT